MTLQVTGVAYLACDLTVTITGILREFKTEYFFRNCIVFNRVPNTIIRNALCIKD